MNDRFVMYNIRNLYNDMRHKGKTQEKFSFKIKHITFEVIFLIDRSPFELLIGVVGEQLAFTLEMGTGFKVPFLPDDVFRTIRDLLKLNPSGESFTSFKFLRELDSSSPACCTTYRVQPHEVARYKSDIPDEKKIYFIGWNDHQLDKRHAQNFAKTRKLMGDDVADFCEAHNISSRWSDKKRDAVQYKEPSGYKIRLFPNEHI